MLPQHPRPDSRWVEDFTEDECSYWTHRLGNLLLLNRTENSEARNDDFDKKKVKYFTGEHGAAIFALTTQVLSTSAWTPTVLAERHRGLTGQLVAEWQLA